MFLVDISHCSSFILTTFVEGLLSDLLVECWIGVVVFGVERRNILGMAYGSCHTNNISAVSTWFPIKIIHNSCDTTLLAVDIFYKSCCSFFTASTCLMSSEV